MRRALVLVPACGPVAPDADNDAGFASTIVASTTGASITTLVESIGHCAVPE